MSKTLTDLTTALGKRSGSSALELLVGLPANPLALPPNANGTYPTLVTSILHPHLLPDAIVQIGKLEFPPTHLGRLLPSHTIAPQAPLSLVVGPNGEAQFVSAAPIPGATALLREVPDILAFVEAWMVFMSVLQNEHLDLPVAQGLSAYLNNIITIARVYSWPAVLDYHVAFMQLRARDAYFNPLSWAESSPHLHTTHLLIPSIHFPPAAAPPIVMPPLPAAAAPAVMSAQERTRMAGQPCYAWNGPVGCAGCARRHVCRICYGAHPATACTGPAAPAVPATV
ncbi:hypothetical protein B0H14DRAFT_2394468 [Mycena olivaceomarginata]|nr:hypothetical protein B0H14DRAFT_2394468 [Mycena olivaceomarginata]